LKRDNFERITNVVLDIFHHDNRRQMNESSISENLLLKEKLRFKYVTFKGEKKIYTDKDGK